MAELFRGGVGSFSLEDLLGVTDTEVLTDDVTFIVEDSECVNNCAVHLSPIKMEALNIWYGVTILLEGNCNRKTICTALTDEKCGLDKIRMNKVVRRKLGVSLGETVLLGSFHEIPKGRRILVRPILEKEDKSAFLQENLFESYLRPYFFGAHRPVNKGDVFTVNGLERDIKFKVMRTLPSPFCVVGPATIIDCKEIKTASKLEKEKTGAASKNIELPAASVKKVDLQ